MNQPTKRSRGRPRSAKSEYQTSTVQALDRGLAVLTALANQAQISLSELAEQLDIPASTTHRLLATLQKHGFAEFDTNAQDWMIGIEAFRVGNAFTARTTLVEASQPILRQLMEDTGETANLAIADNGDVVFISQVEALSPIRAFFRAGTRGLMHASGIGKVLLADMSRPEVEKIARRKGLPQYTHRTLTELEPLLHDLDATRTRGWSYDDEERHLGMRCIAAPIYGPDGRAIAGLSISGSTVRLSNLVVSEVEPKVRKAAEKVTQLIGGKMPQVQETR